LSSVIRPSTPAVGETGLISLLQQAVRDGERGRIFGAFAMAANAGEAVGMIAAGSLGCCSAEPV